MDGAYSISVSGNDAVLVFSFVGYQSREIVVGTQTVINVEMQETATSIEEVVVVGYGTQKKANLTGAVSSVRVNDIKDVPVSNTAGLLQGRMSGVTVSSFSAQPGKEGDVEIRIRGIGTFGNNNPLILIDGVEGSLGSVAPSDIESISVLKDAASAAIYGVRAANGVILVTTKRGTGAGKVTYSGSYGIQSASVLPKFLDSWQWATLFNEENNELGGTYPAYNYTDDMIRAMNDGSDPDHFANTNWMKEVFRSAPIHNHHLSMTGGGQNSNYLASVGYINQKGIMKGTDTERFNFRLNAESKYLDMITLGMNTAGSYQKVAEPLGGTWNIFAKIVDANKPTVPVKYNNGEWGQYDGNPQIPMYQGNPVEMTTFVSNENIYRFDGKFFLDIEPVKNLHLKSSFAYQHIQDNTSYFEPIYKHYKSDGTFTQSGIPSLKEESAMYRQWMNENIIVYSLNLDNTHAFNFLLGESNQYKGKKNSTA
jgi:TonB-linked SusC/RagA family outer membrane protein